MPYPEHFAEYPPFPDDVPVVNIPKISLAKLASEDEYEIDALYEACKEYGFFFLDLLSSSAGQQLLNNAVNMFEVSKTTLGLDKATLDKYACTPPKSLNGYKAAGIMKTDDGRLDAIEVYTLAQDDITSLTAPRANPPPIETHHNDCREFFQNAAAVTRIILTRLDAKLGLPLGTLAALCPLDKSSDTALRMLRAAPNLEDNRIAFGGHTDIGIITMLFNVVGGLQILPAASENIQENWRFIRPEPGHAVINLGDTLVEWTGGILRSSLHRVVKPPGAQAQSMRQSLAYLVRAANDANMERLKSPVIPPSAAGEQEDKKSVSDWAAMRALQIMKGEVRPRTNGGQSPVTQSGRGAVLKEALST